MQCLLQIIWAKSSHSFCLIAAFIAKLYMTVPKAPAFRPYRHVSFSPTFIFNAEKRQNTKRNLTHLLVQLLFRDLINRHIRVGTCVFFVGLQAPKLIVPLIAVSLISRRCSRSRLRETCRTINVWLGFRLVLFLSLKRFTSMKSRWFL